MQSNHIITHTFVVEDCPHHRDNVYFQFFWTKYLHDRGEYLDYSVQISAPLKEDAGKLTMEVKLAPSKWFGSAERSNCSWVKRLSPSIKLTETQPDETKFEKTGTVHPLPFRVPEDPFTEYEETLDETQPLITVELAARLERQGVRLAHVEGRHFVFYRCKKVASRTAFVLATTIGNSQVRFFRPAVLHELVQLHLKKMGSCRVRHVATTAFSMTAVVAMVLQKVGQKKLAVKFLQEEDVVEKTANYLKAQGVSRAVLNHTGTFCVDSARAQFLERLLRRFDADDRLIGWLQKDGFGESESESESDSDSSCWSDCDDDSQ